MGQSGPRDLVTVSARASCVLREESEAFAPGENVLSIPPAGMFGWDPRGVYGAGIKVAQNRSRMRKVIE